MKIGQDDVGTIEIALFGEIVPKTVRNFVELAKLGNQKGEILIKLHKLN